MKLNGQQLAEHFGVTPGAVSQWRAAGMPSSKSKGRGLAYDVDQCAAWLRANGKAAEIRRDSKNAGAAYAKQDGPDEGSLMAAKVRQANAVAERLERENLVRTGALVDKNGVELAAQRTARTLRDALIDTLPSKISLELAAITDPWQIECKLRDAIRAELQAVVGLLQAAEERQ